MIMLDEVFVILLDSIIESFSLFFVLFSHYDIDGILATRLSSPQISRYLLNPASKDFFPWISGLERINTIPVSKLILVPMF